MIYFSQIFLNLNNHGNHISNFFKDKIRHSLVLKHTLKTIPILRDIKPKKNEKRNPTTSLLTTTGNHKNYKVTKLTNFTPIRNTAKSLQMTINSYLVGGSSITSNKPLMIFCRNIPWILSKLLLKCCYSKFNLKYRPRTYKQTPTAKLDT